MAALCWIWSCVICKDRPDRQVPMRFSYVIIAKGIEGGQPQINTCADEQLVSKTRASNLGTWVNNTKQYGRRSTRAAVHLPSA